jgi:phage tail tape-measure protein
MDFGKFHFGTIKIDGVTYEYDVVIDRGKIRKRKKKRSPPRNSARSSGTLRSRLKRRCLGSAAARNRHRKIWIASGDGRGETLRRAAEKSIC